MKVRDRDRVTPDYCVGSVCMGLVTSREPHRGKSPYLNWSTGFPVVVT